MLNYDIGLAYKDKRNRFWLAITKRKLLSVRNNKILFIQPISQYKLYKYLPVENLADCWGITLDQFDQIVQKFIFVPEAVLHSKRKAKGRRRTSDQTLEAIYRALRTVKIPECASLLD